MLTELRPGVYVFNDAQQWELGTVGPDRIALSARATVVSHAGGRRGRRTPAARCSAPTGRRTPPASAGCRRTRTRGSCSSPSTTRVVDLAGAPLPPLGSRVDVVPNHVCAAVNLVDELWADTGDGLIRWPVAARGRNG